MIYSLMVIAISAVNISYSSENPDYPDLSPTSNSTSGNTTGCNIYDMHQVSYGFAIGHIVLALITILGCMCVQTSKKQFDSSELHEIQPEYWVVISAIVGGICLTVATLSYGSHLDNPYYKDIGKFSASDCSHVRIRLLYASLLITGLPMILFGLVLGILTVGGITYSVWYAIYTWMRSFVWVSPNCCDCARFWLGMGIQNHGPNNTNNNNNNIVKQTYTRPQSLNAIRISQSVRYSELQQQPNTTIVIQPPAYSDS
jgi:hypothetical protein